MNGKFIAKAQLTTASARTKFEPLFMSLASIAASRNLWNASEQQRRFLKSLGYKIRWMVLSEKLDGFAVVP